MKRNITIVDYGLGNLHSVAKSFQFLGCTVDIASDAAAIERAERVVLPGVGAFADGIAGLQQRQQDSKLIAYAAEGRPLLGICLGAQLLMEQSEEFGSHRGLGIIAGHVERIRPNGVKVPHVGWAQLVPPGDAPVFRGILSNLPTGGWTYFIHSLQIIPTDCRHLLCVCRYGEQLLTAGVNDGLTYGLQFHPEKSGDAGLEILRAFSQL